MFFVSFQGFSQLYRKGEAVQIIWKGNWYPGKIEEVKCDEYLISYDGYDSTSHETVRANRLKAGVSTATNTSIILTTTKINNLNIDVIKIDSLEIIKTDLGNMNWDDAKKACEKLGNGWRLPTLEELNLLYKYRDTLGGFKNNYWSSKEYTINYVWYLGTNGFANKDGDKNWTSLSVRAVRDLSITPKIQKPITIIINNLEVYNEDLPSQSWDGAKKACEKLGSKWRLPTIKEFDLLYKNRDKLCGLNESAPYWSILESDSEGALGYYFFNKSSNYIYKFKTACVRPVRDIK